MELKEAQARVDAWISQFEEGYWPPMSNLARLMEEVGELARLLHHLLVQQAGRLLLLLGQEQASGRRQEAQGGTLVLDQISDANLEVQAKLLSALEEGRFLRVGGQQFLDMNVRIIATTNRDLPALVREGGSHSAGRSRTNEDSHS